MIAAIRLALLAVCLGAAVTARAADYQAGFAAWAQQDYPAALRAWRPLAEAGNARAQRNLAVMYRDGRGVPRNARAALDWFSRAAGQGDASAQYELAKILDKGIGTPPDADQALQWYRAAAARNHSGALLALARRHRQTDPAAARDFLERAARAGASDAALMLGDMFGSSAFGLPDHAAARSWYKQAAARGRQEAVRRLAALDDPASPDSPARTGTAPMRIAPPITPPITPTTRPQIITRLLPIPDNTGPGARPTADRDQTPAGGLAPATEPARGNAAPTPAPTPDDDIFARVVIVPKPARGGPASLAAAPPDRPGPAPGHDTGHGSGPGSGTPGRVRSAAIRIEPAPPAEPDQSMEPDQPMEPDRTMPVVALSRPVPASPGPASPALPSPALTPGPLTPAAATAPAPAVGTPRRTGTVDDRNRAAVCAAILDFLAGAGQRPASPASHLTAADRPAFAAALAAYRAGDYDTALRGWQALADRGVPEASSNLGTLYDQGVHVPQDFERALALFRSAATAGLAAAQFNLGVMHAEGRGVPAQATTAARWHLLAAGQGHDEAAAYVRAFAHARCQNLSTPRAAAAPPASEDGSVIAVAAMASSPVATDAARPPAPVPPALVPPGATTTYQAGAAAFARGDWPTARRVWAALAAAGDADAMFATGLLHERGQGGPVDRRAARTWLQAAADQGHPEARHRLASLRPATGQDDLRRAADALQRIGGSLLVAPDQGLHGFPDPVMAGMADTAEWRRVVRSLASTVWRPWARLDAAREAYTDGRYQQAVALWRQGALAGNATAQNNLGVALALGQGVAQNLDEAGTWFATAAENGLAEADINLGLLALRHGRGDPAEAVDRFVANLERQAAQYNLGVALATGTGVAQDMNAAATAFRGAAAGGHADALYNMAFLYQRGISVRRDPGRSLALLHSAAEAGSTVARMALGWRYATGTGVPVNMRKAASLFRGAAADGHPAAQYNLGLIYGFGLTGQLVYAFRDTVAQDLARAHFWLSRAAAKDFAPARQRLAALLLQLSEEDRARARTFASQPDHGVL